MRTDILGVGFDAVTLTEAVVWTMDRILAHAGAVVCTPNPEIVWASRANPALRGALSGADLVLPDGVGILWGARILKRPLPERVAGYDFCMKLMGTMKGCVFLLGGRPGVARRAGEALAERFPNVKICGALDGYFSDDAPVVEAIARAAPDFLMVCLGSPKQEIFMAKNRRSLNAGAMAGLGGCLDVLAGGLKRAPDWWIAHKLEWLYRLIHEPRRIKRQAVLPLYLAAVTAQRFKHE